MLQQLNFGIRGNVRFILLLGVLGAPFASPKTCYNPDGGIDTLSSPCNLAAEQSQCCKEDQVCLDNGYCFGGLHYGNSMTRQSCTDKTWQSSACPYYCADEVSNGGISVVCAVGADISSFCCGGGYNNTSARCRYWTQGSAAPFQVPNGQVIFNRTSGSTGPNSTFTHTATTTAIATTTLTPTTRPTSDNRSVAVGIGVGVSFGPLLVLALGLLWWQTKRSNRLERQLHAKTEASTTLGHKQELTADLNYPQTRELDGRNIAELNGYQPPELNAR